MTAAVISLDEARRRRAPRLRVVARAQIGTMRENLKDLVAQQIMDTYRDCPVAAVDLAVRRAHEVLDNAQTVRDALRIAGGVILDYLADDEHWQRAALDILVRQLRDRLRHRPQIELHKAVRRGRHFLEGGGTISTAVYYALMEHPE